MNIHSEGKYFLFLILSFVGYMGNAQSDKDFVLQVNGEVLRPLKLNLPDLSNFRQEEIRAKDRDNREHVFSGVLLGTILDSAGVTLGQELRGENLAKYILCRAVDGYEVVFSLPEADTSFSGRQILVAIKVDGAFLPKGEGPFRIIVPDDKRHSRWMRELSSIRILYPKE